MQTSPEVILPEGADITVRVLAVSAASLAGPLASMTFRTARQGGNQPPGPINNLRLEFIRFQ